MCSQNEGSARYGSPNMQTGCHVSIIAPRVSAKQNDVSLTPATLDGDRLHLSSMHPQPRAGYQACMQELGSCTAGLTNKFGFGRHLCIPCRQGCNAFHATPCGLQGVLVPKSCITQCSLIFQHQLWQSAHVQSQVAITLLRIYWHGGCAFCALGKLTPHNSCIPGF